MLTVYTRGVDAAFIDARAIRRSVSHPIRIIG